MRSERCASRSCRTESGCTSRDTSSDPSTRCRLKSFPTLDEQGHFPLPFNPAFLPTPDAHPARRRGRRRPGRGVGGAVRPRARVAGGRRHRAGRDRCRGAHARAFLARGAWRPEIAPGRDTVAQAHRAVCELVAGRIGGEVVVFEDSTHNPQLEEPERFNELLLGIWKTSG